MSGLSTPFPYGDSRLSQGEKVGACFWCKDTIKRVETKTCFKYPEREYLSVSDAKIRHKNGA